MINTALEVYLPWWVNGRGGHPLGILYSLREDILRPFMEEGRNLISPVD